MLPTAFPRTEVSNFKPLYAQSHTMKPPIQYTKSGGINIAYQVFGSGPLDLVYIPGWVSNIDWMWACPELVQFFEELGKVARIILFDKRGTGLSDRVVELSTLEERMEDIKAVMNAAGSEKAILFGHSEGGSVSALFSATYPNRVHALIAFGIFAKRRFSKDYPWAPTDEERQKVYDMIEYRWGSGQMNLESLAPSKANDAQFMNWLASYFRSGASPQAAMQLTKMNTEVNIIDILEYIKIPTLLMQRTHDIDVKIEEGKFIAQRIAGAKFVEFEGEDHLFWAGNTSEILHQMASYIRSIPQDTTPKKGLMTVLCGKWKDGEKGQMKSTLITQHIAQYNGKLLSFDKGFFTAAFEVPGKAVNSGLEILANLQNDHHHIQMGMYLKQGYSGAQSVRDNRDHYLIDALFQHAKPNQIVVTQAVKHLLSGSEFQFTKENTVLAYQSAKLCGLYTVENGKLNNQQTAEKLFGTDQDSFLEDVMLIVQEYLDDSTFGVEVLATRMGISERQLQRKMKEVTGKSPGQLITSVRLHKAKDALKSGRYTSAEVAFQFGFSSPSYFSKCFKKEFGITPTEVFTSK